MIEGEAVHLGPNDVVVDLLRDRPAARIDRGEAALPGRELGLLCGHRLRGVVGHAVDELGLLKFPPLREEGHEILVAGAPAGVGRRRPIGAHESRRRKYTGGRQAEARERHRRTSSESGQIISRSPEARD